MNDIAFAVIIIGLAAVSAYLTINDGDGAGWAILAFVAFVIWLWRSL